MANFRKSYFWTTSEENQKFIQKTEIHQKFCINKNNNVAFFNVMRLAAYTLNGKRSKIQISVMLNKQHRNLSTFFLYSDSFIILSNLIFFSLNDSSDFNRYQNIMLTIPVYINTKLQLQLFIYDYIIYAQCT